MPEEVDSFRIGLMLHHPSCDPAAISSALGLHSTGALRAGHQTSRGTRKTTMWMCNFRKGLGNDAFGLALEETLAFLELHRGYLQGFRSEGGEIEVTLSQTIVWDDGVVFEMRLEPFFLQALVGAEATLRVTAWSADPSEPDL
jgi:hypothetical protein